MTDSSGCIVNLFLKSKRGSAMAERAQLSLKTAKLAQRAKKVSLANSYPNCLVDGFDLLARSSLDRLDF
jgi:hypothetical protein